MRAASPPPVLCLSALLALAAGPAAAAAAADGWVRPVPGEVARPFSYDRGAPFAAGAHRGADLAARPGTPVRAACGGTVLHAGPVASHAPVVSIRCAGRRVSHGPLASVTVRAGAVVRAGAAVGTSAAGHGGVHVGVRREADPFGYEDPATLLPAARRPFAPLPRPAGPYRAAPRRVRPRPRPRPLPRPAIPAPPPRPATPVPAPGAPWPVWVGLAVLGSGAAGSGTVVLRRRRRLAHRTAPAGRSLA